KEIIRMNLVQAMTSALPTEEMQKIHEDISHLARIFYRGNLDKERYLELLKQIHLAAQAGQAVFGSHEEFVVALKFLKIDANEAAKIVKHEQDHAAELEKRGLPVKYHLHFGRNADGSLVYLPFVSSAGEVLNYDEYKASTSAPDNLSELDISSIDLTKP
ncbi:MAG: hypothetical protein WCX71_03140, partial [Candidatus Buchananbacteria bacterium]